MSSEQLAVTQGDRDAAADGCGSVSKAKVIRRGEMDHTALVQAFAGYRAALTAPTCGEVGRLEEARTLLQMFVDADEENAPSGLQDCIDNSRQPYQSAFMAGLITHAKMWLKPNDLADRVAGYRAALATQEGADRGTGG